MEYIDNKKIMETQSQYIKLEFDVPISEQFIEDEFKIAGTAINVCTTRNGHTFLAEELKPATPSLEGKPLLKDHNNSVDSIVGQVTNAAFTKNRIDFEAEVSDFSMQDMIKKGLIKNVSVGAMVRDIEFIEPDEEKGTGESFVLRGIEFVELSLVAVPADPGADFAKAVLAGFEMKKKKISEQAELLNKAKVEAKEKAEKIKVESQSTEIEPEGDDENEVDTEAEKAEEETVETEPTVEQPEMEENVKMTDNEIDAVKEQLAIKEAELVSIKESIDASNAEKVEMQETLDNITKEKLDNLKESYANKAKEKNVTARDVSTLSEEIVKILIEELDKIEVKEEVEEEEEKKPEDTVDETKGDVEEPAEKVAEEKTNFIVEEKAIYISEYDKEYSRLNRG